MSRWAQPDAASIAALLDSTARGDRHAFADLYQRTSAKLFGIILRIIPDRTVAEEVLQETFLRVWQKAERYTPEAGHSIAWLAAIARNRAIDRFRADRLSRLQVEDGEAVLDGLAAQGNGDAVMREALRACLSGLEDEARRCVLLAYCSGFSRDELAERFGKPVGTIKTLLHRAIIRLRACLERE